MQLGVGARSRRGEQGHVVAEGNQLLRERVQYPFSAAVFGGWHWDEKWSNLSNLHHLENDLHQVVHSSKRWMRRPCCIRWRGPRKWRRIRSRAWSPIRLARSRS